MHKGKTHFSGVKSRVSKPRQTAAERDFAKALKKDRETKRKLEKDKQARQLQRAAQRTRHEEDRQLHREHNLPPPTDLSTTDQETETSEEEEEGQAAIMDPRSDDLSMILSPEVVTANLNAANESMSSAEIAPIAKSSITLASAEQAPNVKETIVTSTSATKAPTATLTEVTGSSATQAPSVRVETVSVVSALQSPKVRNVVDSSASIQAPSTNVSVTSVVIPTMQVLQSSDTGFSVIEEQESYQTVVVNQTLQNEKLKLLQQKQEQQQALELLQLKNEQEEDFEEKKLDLEKKHRLKMAKIKAEKERFEQEEEERIRNERLMPLVRQEVSEPRLIRGITPAKEEYQHTVIVQKVVTPTLDRLVQEELRGNTPITRYYDDGDGGLLDQDRNEVVLVSSPQRDPKLISAVAQQRQTFDKPMIPSTSSDGKQIRNEESEFEVPKYNRSSSRRHKDDGDDQSSRRSTDYGDRRRDDSVSRSRDRSDREYERKGDYHEDRYFSESSSKRNRDKDDHCDYRDNDKRRSHRDVRHHPEELELPRVCKAVIGGRWTGKIEVLPVHPYCTNMDTSTGNYVNRAWLNSAKLPLGRSVGANVNQIELPIKIELSDVYDTSERRDLCAGNSRKQFRGVQEYPIRLLKLEVVDRPSLPHDVGLGSAPFPWTFLSKRDNVLYPRWDILVRFDDFLKAPIIQNEMIDVYDPVYEMQVITKADYSNSVKGLSSSNSMTVESASGSGKISTGFASNDVKSQFQFPGKTEEDRQVFMKQSLTELQADYDLLKVGSGQWAAALTQAKKEGVFVWGANACEPVAMGKVQTIHLGSADTPCTTVWDAQDPYSILRVLRTISSGCMAPLANRLSGEVNGPNLTEQGAVHSMKVLLTTVKGPTTDQGKLIMKNLQQANVEITHPMAWNVIVGSLVHTFCNPNETEMRRTELLTKYQRKEETNSDHAQRLYNGCLNCGASGDWYEKAYLQTTACKRSWSDLNQKRLQRRSRNESFEAVTLIEAHTDRINFMTGDGSLQQKATLDQRGWNWVEAEKPLADTANALSKKLSAQVRSVDANGETDSGRSSSYNYGSSNRGQQHEYGRGASNSNRGSYNRSSSNSRENNNARRSNNNNGNNNGHYRNDGNNSSQSGNEQYRRTRRGRGGRSDSAGASDSGQHPYPRSGDLNYGIAVSAEEATRRSKIVVNPVNNDRAPTSTWREGDKQCAWCKFTGHMAPCCPSFYQEHPGVSYNDWTTARWNQYMDAKEARRSQDRTR